MSTNESDAFREYIKDGDGSRARLLLTRTRQAHEYSGEIADKLSNGDDDKRGVADVAAYEGIAKVWGLPYAFDADLDAAAQSIEAQYGHDQQPPSVGEET